MSRRLRAGLVGLLGLLLAAACTNDGGTSTAVSDASHELAPGRQVVEDIPDGFFTPRDMTEVPPVSTGSPPLGGDSGPGMSEAGQGDGGTPDAARDLPRETAGACDLLRQDCGDADGCYPGSDGNGVCSRAGGRAENVDCAAHDECLPGYICAEGVAGGGLMCLRVCDPRAPTTCPGGRGCRVHASISVGSCAP